MPPKSRSEEASTPWLDVKEIFGKTPNRLERATVEYVQTFTEESKSTLAVESYVKFVVQRDPTARAKFLVRVWTAIQSYVAKNGPDYLQRAFEGIQPLTVQEATRLLKDTRKTLKHDSPVESEENPVLAEARLKKAKADAPDTNNTEGSENFNRSRNSDKSSSGSSGSSTLSLGTLQSMREQYEQHYKSFSGEPWTLASGTIVDEAIRSMVLTLTKESTLHSFVIDAPKKVLDLFEGEDRKAVEQGLLTKRDTNSADDAALKSAMAFLEKYISTPSATQTALSRGWRVDRNTEPQQLQDPVLFSDYIGDDDTQYWLYTIVLQLHRAYKQERFRLPMTNSESWYINKLWAFLPTLLCGPGGPGNALIHQPGEVQSKASVQRKNADRTLASKWIPGRKIDGLFICAKTGFELGAIEAARTDAGIQTTTKALSDSRKLGKLLKDMHDAVRNKACKEVQDELVTFGMQISRTTICLYTLHKVAGRHYCMQNDGAFTLPLEWDNEPESAAAILHLLDRLLQWRKQMEDMAKNVARWTRTGPPDGHYRDVIVPTLPSPSSSPKSERLSYF